MLPSAEFGLLNSRTTSLIRSPTSLLLSLYRGPHRTSSMDMGDMDGSNSSSTTAMSMMKPWLHFSGGDTLFFKNLIPNSGGAIAGACFIFFFIAIIERWLSAYRCVMECKWKHSARLHVAGQYEKMHDRTSSLPSADCHSHIEGRDAPLANRHQAAKSRRRIAPFIAANDLARGGFQLGQSALQSLLMLTVMTFHAGYIISIVVGLGVGEMVFARLYDGADLHGHTH